MKSIRCSAKLLAATTSVLAFLPTLSFGADAIDQASIVNARDIKWEPAPPSMPKGAMAAVLFGDPRKAGPFAMRLKAPANYKIPPHWHSNAENLTVISGTLYLGTGDKMDVGAAHALKSGGFHHLPAKIHHYAFAKEPAVVQINGDGPFDITYVNSDDDPQKVEKK